MVSHPVLPSPQWLWRATLLAWAAGAAACAAGAPDGRYAFDRFGTDEGLPQSNVSAVLQTADGYLWVGTEGGLARFDGVRFVPFDTSNTPAFLSDSVQCLLQARDGALWVGTESGLLRERGDRFELMGLAGMSVRALAEDRAGRIWAGTHRQGLYLWDGRQMAPAGPAGPAVPLIAALGFDARGRLWIAAEHVNGPLYWDGGAYRRDPATRDIRGLVISIAAEPDGTVWFGSYHNGLYGFRPPNSLRQFQPEPRLSVADIRSDPDGRLRIAAGGVFESTDAGRSGFQAVPGLPTESVRSLCLDREGSLWLGCGRGDGLIRVRRVFHRSYTTAEGLPGNSVRTVAADSQGRLWLAIAEAGVTRIGPDGKVDVLDAAQGFPSPDASIVYPAADGSIWAGLGTHLFVWRNGQGRTIDRISSVYGIYQDRDRALWIGTRQQGLFRIAPGSEEPLPAWPGVLYATSFAEAADGSLYVGTWNSGLYRIKGGAAEHFSHDNGLPSDEVREVFVDREGLLWVGFKGRGLAVREGARWLNPNELSKAVADHVTALAEDDRGQLWLGTAAGVMRAPRDQLVAAVRGLAPLPKMGAIAVRQGFRGASVWSGPQPAVWKAADGKLLFATRGGLLEIDPAHLASNPVVPPVRIETVALDHRLVDFRGGVRVPAGTRSVAIDYTALTFLDPRHVYFRYRLEGYDREWIEAGTRRTAYYSDLPGGRYRFRVLACNSDGVWNQAGDACVVAQLPFFYQTWWFRGASVLAVVGLGVRANRWSHRRLKQRAERLEERSAMERERQRIAKDLHDDLGANLTALGLLAESVGRKTEAPELRRELEHLRIRVRGMADGLDTIVWAVNPANDTLDSLAAYLCGFFQDLFRLAPMRGRLDVAQEIPSWPLSPEARSQIFFAAKEAMRNVIKHSDATECWLRMRTEGTRFLLSIEDDGRGVDPADAEPNGRNGLANIRSRMAGIGGEVRIDTALGRGMRVRISADFGPR